MSQRALYWWVLCFHSSFVIYWTWFPSHQGSCFLGFLLLFGGSILVTRIDLSSAIVLSTFAQEFLSLTSSGSSFISASLNSSLLWLIMADIPGAVSTRMVAPPCPKCPASWWPQKVWWSCRGWRRAYSWRRWRRAYSWRPSGWPIAPTVGACLVSGDHSQQPQFFFLVA